MLPSAARRLAGPYTTTRAYTNVPAKDAAKAVGAFTQHEKIKKFVLDNVALCKPERVHFCDGSEAEKKMLVDQMVRVGTLVPLNPKLRPNSYLARSDPTDVARVEKQTLICAPSKDDVGPTNNWADIEETRAEMEKLYNGCMQGRTLYVVPYSMGPLGSKLSYPGVQITDSPYVVQSMKIMSRMGTAALEAIGRDGAFVPGMHSVGMPLTSPTQEDSSWPCNPTKRITHFPKTREIMSYGSGYGGNALLGKKCFALRIAGAIAKDEGWLAEHMLILGVTPPGGKKKYVAAAFPSACGKTNFAMMKATLPGFKIECVGDDIAWLRFVDGKLHAINPEAGFFGVAPGTGPNTNPYAIASCAKDTIFTNVGLTPDMDVWWEGLSKPAPAVQTDWLRREWHAGETKYPAAHPNSRFCAPASNCPIMDPAWEDPKGVPIDAIIFGGRRSTTVPLVYQSRSWQHGTFMGATMGSEQTAAAEGKVGAFRPDPMAMIPFGDYFQHWLNIGATPKATLPKIFFVNFFLKNEEGHFIWPGFGDNARLLKWMCERMDGTGKGVETAIGVVPDYKNGAIDTSGLNLSSKQMDALFTLDKKLWTNEVATYRQTLKSFGGRVPKALFDELETVEKNVKNM
jgi:phosphoenolpyruvate carboxykinase (GTP)